VTRVEYHVAREALALGAQLVRFDDTMKTFVLAALPINFGRSPNEIEILLTDTPPIPPPLLKRRAIRKMRKLAAFLSKEPAAGLNAEIDAKRIELAWLLAYNFEFLTAAERFYLASYAHVLEPQTLCLKFYYWITVERGKRSAVSGPQPTRQIGFQSGDKLLSLHATWDQEYSKALEQLASQGVAVVVLIYDMIPITHSSFLAASEADRFKTYLERMLKSEIRLTTISRSSQEEITNYCRDTLGFTKYIALTPLGSSASRDDSTASHAIVEAGLENSPFVLMVGSFEPRKNQKFFLDIWRATVPRLAEPPALVFAGGLASASYLQELQQDAHDLERVSFFFNVDDEELAWFYEHCLFTAFPSEAEGWGLPITEALDRGKYCLASDNPALKEAGEGLVFHAPLQDREAWVEELFTLLSDPLALEERSKRIRERHRPRTWADITRAMLAI
jgi:glycosyltransferase involved in cell wall biosynthesis